jgi:hypothetical protein
VSEGFSTGLDVSGLVRSIRVNGTTFAFDVAPVGTRGPAGPAGPAGKTTIVQAPVPAGGVLGTQASSCKGDDLLTLRAARRSGQRFLSQAPRRAASACRPRAARIRLDLRGRDEGNYDVRIVARYRTKSGRVVRIVTHRVRSVACA